MFLTAFQGGVLHYIWFHKKLPESSVAGILQGLSESGVMAFNWGSWANPQNLSIQNWEECAQLLRNTLEFTGSFLAVK